MYICKYEFQYPVFPPQDLRPHCARPLPSLGHPVVGPPPLLSPSAGGSPLLRHPLPKAICKGSLPLSSLGPSVGEHPTSQSSSAATFPLLMGAWHKTVAPRGSVCF